MVVLCKKQNYTRIARAWWVEKEESQLLTKKAFDY
jgi:hypothetical protein